ncbi:MAG TPA: sigma-70 family RNA polymerase sigma factor [Steroidobacteraceae bacterium]|jgi:RNA polymerase sigma-70 factor (ECF subfamily)
MSLAYACRVPERAPINACDDAALVRVIVAARPDIAPEAEAELCRRLGPRLRLYGLKHLRDASAAADLVQQVLLITLQRLRAGELREPERIVSFVLGTARLTVLELRRGPARREQLLNALSEEATVAQIEISSEVEQRRLVACLYALSERERSIVILTFCHDRPAEDIAAELGVAAGNLRVIRHRALERLRACLSARERPQ